MGTVDLARDSQGNKVAMKRLTLHGSANEMLQARQRLLREAHILRRLNHPNIVRLLDVVEDGDEIILVMPFLPGGNLAERVSQHGPAPAAEVQRLAQSLLGALAAAHAAGVVHRDLKPGNVLYDSQGEPLLADFGLAFSWDQTAGLTAAGMVVGTPGFIAPEQARGEALTPASDVFSLGATLRFAATGAGPFGTGDPTLLMVRAADAKIEKLPHRLPAPLRHLLSLMLEPRPERRPTAAELLTGTARPRSRPTRAMVGGAAAALLVVGVALVASRDGNDDAGGVDETGLNPDVSGSGSGDEGPAPGEPRDGSTPLDRDEGRPIEDQVDGTLSPDDESDTLAIPLADQPGTSCPREVTLTLRPPPGVTLELSVQQGDLALDQQTATADAPAEVVFHPQSCEDEYQAVVTTVDALRAETDYTLLRDDA
jgi:eukaryotic-like serine/threonine-protein kinase